MSTPDPLHLADLLEAGDTYDCGPLVVYGWPVRASYEPTDDAAAELRRQHAELERLTAERDAIRALLPDELFPGSKDWTQGGLAQRVDCLKTWLADAQAEARVAYLAFDRVTAERDALRAALQRIVDWDAAGLALTEDNIAQARAALAAAPAQAPQPFYWPKLDKPAKVGGGTFGIGVSARLVVEAAQRQHEYAEAEGRKTPEEAQKAERARRELWDMLNGAPAPASSYDRDSDSNQTLWQWQKTLVVAAPAPLTRDQVKGRSRVCLWRFETAAECAAAVAEHNKELQERQRAQAQKG